MNWVVAISASAAAVNFTISLLCLVLSQGPGWRPYRLLAVVAFLLGLYGLNDALILHGAFFPALVGPGANLCIALASLTPAVWLQFYHSRYIREVPLLDKSIVTALYIGSILSNIPGLAVEGIHVTSLESLDLRYLTPETTSVGDIFLIVDVVAMALLLYRYVSRARGGSIGDKLSVLGVGFVIALAVEEALVSYNLLPWPYLADLGAAGTMLSFAAEMSSRVWREAQGLRELHGSLGESVQTRSRELAQTRDALLLSERHAALEQLASGVGHEINNPLSYVSDNLSFLRDYKRQPPWSEEDMEAINDALSGVTRISKIVEDLTSSSESDDSANDVADVLQALDGALQISKQQLAPHLSWRIELHKCSNVLIDESKLTQVLVNILINAAQASTRAESQHITIRGSHEGNSQTIEILDEGEGISNEDMKRIFDPLYTTKEVGKGTGLGLFVSRSIVENAGGSIEIQSEVGEGTCVTVRLEATTRSVSNRLVPRSSQSVSIDALRIYLVDDENMVTRALGRILSDADVSIENDSAAALRHLQEAPDYDVVICDLMMPGTSGMDIFEAISPIAPDLAKRFIFITGGAVTSAAENFLERPDLLILKKPITSDDLRAAIVDIATRV